MKILLLLVVLACAPIIAKADQITGGSYRFTFNGASVESLAFSGARFSVNGLASTTAGISVPAAYSCVPCVAGTTINLNSSAWLHWADWHHGTVTVDGVSYPVYQTLGFGALSDMAFIAGSVFLPETTNSSITFSVPFSLSRGGISGQGYSVTFTNSGGLATVIYNRIGTDAQGRTLYTFNSLTYNFQAQPTPEPMTIALLGSGLVALGLRLRKRP